MEPTQRTTLAVGRLGGRLPLNLALTSAHVDYPIKPTASARRRRDARRGCTAGRFCLGIEALRRHAVAGARFHSPSIAENLHRAELTLVACAEHIAASIRLTAAKAEAISPRVGEKLK